VALSITTVVSLLGCEFRIRLASSSPELAAVVREAKQMATRIEQPSDLWELERYLTQRRKETDRQYVYRYSILPFVFADLIRKGRLREEELYGLAEGKLGYIR
jgi:hypothetical protein